MDSMTTKKAAELWGVTVRQVQLLCERGKIDGAVRFGDIWAIPQNAIKPIDGRTKAARESKENQTAGGKKRGKKNHKL